MFHFAYCGRAVLTFISGYFCFRKLVPEDGFVAHEMALSRITNREQRNVYQLSYPSGFRSQITIMGRNDKHFVYALPEAQVPTVMELTV
uniref:MSP domain-containing protein n=1 Tax=Steinernema glaseri TaxID=37863 RepID=A0A1I8AQ31_9BILA